MDVSDKSPGTWPAGWRVVGRDIMQSAAQTDTASSLRHLRRDPKRPVRVAFRRNHLDHRLEVERTINVRVQTPGCRFPAQLRGEPLHAHLDHMHVNRRAIVLVGHSFQLLVRRGVDEPFGGEGGRCSSTRAAGGFDLLTRHEQINKWHDSLSVSVIRQVRSVSDRALAPPLSEKSPTIQTHTRIVRGVQPENRHSRRAVNNYRTTVGESSTLTRVGPCGLWVRETRHPSDWPGEPA